MEGQRRSLNMFENDVAKSHPPMYGHSDPALMDAETESKYISRFQPRVSKYVAVSHDACIECHIDLFGTGGIGKVVGGMNAHTADFTALCAPEALPERIGLCSYFIEYAFVHDDVSVDAVHDGPSCRLSQDKDGIISKALGSKRFEDLQDTAEGGLKRKQARAKIWSVLNEIDQDYLGRCQKKFKQWYETGQQMRDKTFASLEDYLAVRALDCGANWVVHMMGWASGVELTPEEEVETGPVTYLAFVVLGVTNDLWSWEKEKRVTRQSGDTLPLINAVQMVMRMQDTTEESAKQIVRTIIREHEEQYCLLRDEYLGRPGTSLSVQKWFQVLELSMAGNALWSIHALRYHLDEVWNLFNVTGSEADQARAGEGETGPTYKVLDALDETVLWKPYEYMTSMPSKGFRHHLIDALQTWFNVPERSLMLISGVASLLHEASLMLDDIQDGSLLRRGKPAVHKIFGVGQTINSACFHINNALRLVQQLSPSAVLVFSGQSFPNLLINKRSGFDMRHFMDQLGRCFQIRDDYQNLVSKEYTSQRGFCQDLDEGKPSFPFIRAYHTLEDSTVLTEWLNMLRSGDGASIEAKRYILIRIEESGSLKYTQDVLGLLHDNLEGMLRDMESMTRQENWILRSMLVQLQIKQKESQPKESTFAEVLRVWGGYRETAWRSMN
ncbi:putative polyprenyl synthetase [Aspergillus fischeri NRRL 181]|uniref:Polyprenyl synthetase, putative n=1 Tax=Neosartorya fischeri (strain ATCC 1020 / DSM 3700 / CBS 544.65 / FGSC A1164 / JCM 1740 / NRRL 181 / WB 181) TaxID=331117 RepID=A1D5T4_NEOFI|nr:polyprenyl synthetase, putative [Aspergillus fischeri NRRL 181]EAW21078.1 polyprenyl synthetase, putative [Aspergillus fischeri NRRL 181]